MSMDKKLTSAVYAAVEKAYDHRCDIEDAADEILEIIKADRQRRGGPVFAWYDPTTGLFTRNKDDPDSGIPAGSCLWPLYREAPTLHNSDSGAPNAEPVGYIMPTALKQLKAGGNAIVGGVSQGGDVAEYLAPQPAKSTFTTPDCPRCGCVQDGQCLCNPSKQPAEPSGRSKLGPLHNLTLAELCDLGMRDCSQYSDDDLAIAWELFDRLLAGDLKDAQPSESVKVPSDEDLLDMWDEIAGSGKSDEALEFAYALLDRYGQQPKDQSK